jgi:hypothetical protein
MADIEIDSQYLPMFSALMEVCRQRNVALSEHSIGLLYLATD